ncbi:MAG: class I SAM-dependent methyltransferase [Verrucomicrobiota bacterium]
MPIDERQYWNELADHYQRQTRISRIDFHYGPLLHGDSQFRLLPPKLDGLHCLELGCGGVQNSLFLASKGAICTATDISERQLYLARQSIADCGTDIRLLQADMDALPIAPPSRFDLIHTNSLGFSRDPGAVVSHAANLLAPDGTLLAATHHTAFAGEWLEVDEEEEGMFLTDYHHPCPDLRESETASDAAARCQAYAPSDVHHWFTAAGLLVDAFLEPVAPRLAAMTDAQISRTIPYDSPDWRALLPQLQRFPFMSILRGRKMCAQ